MFERLRLMLERYEKLTELINRYDTKNKLEELNHGI